MGLCTGDERISHCLRDGNFSIYAMWLIHLSQTPPDYSCHKNYIIFIISQTCPPAKWRCRCAPAGKAGCAKSEAPAFAPG